MVRRNEVSGTMAAQNIYDDPDFLARYATLDRQVRGLDGAPEWPAMRDLLPPMTGRRVVDLGCGFGWFSRWAAAAQARSVLGVDLSEAMLTRARADTSEPSIEYRQGDLDDLELDPGSADVVFSSLALHYVVDLSRLLSTLALGIPAGGSLVFSVEHPIYSAPTTQSFEESDAGHRIWPLDNYLVEGERVTNWFVDGVRKQHRTVATYVNAVIDSGFGLDRMVEWGPSPDDVEARPELADDLHRPWFLLLSATRR